MLLRYLRLSLTVSTLFWLGATAAITGQPGTLDTGFNVSGTVITSFGAGSNRANAVAVQPDGKLVLAGYCSNGTNNDFCALRYNANGTLDNSFNGSGTVITPVGIGNDYANALVLQADGKLILAGYCNNGARNDFCAVRYNANGTLDTSFNGTGIVITSIGTGSNNGNAVILQPDGKIVLAGSCLNGTSYSFCALRYNTDGSLDTSFNLTGKVITAVGNRVGYAAGLAVQPDGKLLLAGQCLGSSDYDFCAVRYLSDGTLDTGFNGSGTIITPVGNSTDWANAIVLQPDGKIVLAGFCNDGTKDDFCALRYKPNGVLDVTFNGTGSVITPVVAGIVGANAVVLQPDGKLVLAGRCQNGAANDFCALRYNSNGALDTAFNGTGIVVTPVGTGSDNSNALALQPDGKLVLVGNCANGANDTFCAVRYEGGPFGYRNCSLDIDGDGAVLVTTDSLIHARIALGITGPAVIGGITFAPNATRNTWPLIRDYLVTQCGMSLVQ